MKEDAAAVAPPLNAKSAANGSPLRLYAAHFVLGQPADDEGAEGAADAKLLHQYLYEHPNGLFIVGLGELIILCSWWHARLLSLFPFSLPLPNDGLLTTACPRPQPTAELHAAIQAARSGQTTVSRIDFLPSFPAAKREDRAVAAAAMQEDGAGEGTEPGGDVATAEDDEEQEQQFPAAAAATPPAAVSAAADCGGEARVAALVAGNRVAAGTRRGRKKNRGDLLVKAGTVLASVEMADGRVFHVQWYVWDGWGC